MLDEATTLDPRETSATLPHAPDRLRLHRRVRVGMRRPANWWQFIRFGIVGASGYVVNLATYTFMLKVIGVDFRVAAAVAFVVALTNNFVWNRHWTFKATDGPAHFQAIRFVVVSVIAFGGNLALLWALVHLSVPEVAAQAIAIALVAPINFIGTKLWSFKA
jgi:putative flippase GtrA